MRTIYMLRCNDNSLYTGITTDLERRISEHNDSSLGARYTKARRPVILVRSQEVEDRSSASKLELQLKKMTKVQKEILTKNQKKISF